MLRRFAKWLLKAGGWTTVGGIPEEPKAVFIAAPHTSNWDGLWALAYKVAFDIDVHFFAKHSLFWFPLGNILRALGGIDLDRGKAGTAVDEAIRLFKNKEQLYFGLAPEGTRKKTAGWKTGFYRIAMGAGVPDLSSVRSPFRHASRVERVSSSFSSGSAAAMHWPEKASPVVFP